MIFLWPLYTNVSSKSSFKSKITGVFTNSYFSRTKNVSFSFAEALIHGSKIGFSSMTLWVMAFVALSLPMSKDTTIGCIWVFYPLSWISFSLPCFYGYFCSFVHYLVIFVHFSKCTDNVSWATRFCEIIPELECFASSCQFNSKSLFVELKDEFPKLEYSPGSKHSLSPLILCMVRHFFEFGRIRSELSIC